METFVFLHRFPSMLPSIMSCSNVCRTYLCRAMLSLPSSVFAIQVALSRAVVNWLKGVPCYIVSLQNTVLLLVLSNYWFLFWLNNLPVLMSCGTAAVIQRHIFWWRRTHYTASVSRGNVKATAISGTSWEFSKSRMGNSFSVSWRWLGS